MDVYVKEMLHVLDYDNHIVDTLFNSDDHITAGYAYNIVVKDANTGYSDLSFDMPNTVLDKDGNKSMNPKLKHLTALVKLRYSREVYYMGEEDLIVREPVGYGDATTYQDVVYKGKHSYPENIIENFVMDYIVQPVDKSRATLQITTHFTAIDYPRFTLSKKRVGLMIDDTTVTKPEWSLFSDKKPISQPGVIKYKEWNRDLSAELLKELTGEPSPSDDAIDAFHAQKGAWNPLTATDYPLSKKEVDAIIDDASIWDYGFMSTSFYWPVTETGRFKGILYEKGDWIAFQGYDLLKLQPAGLDPELYIEDKAWHWFLIKPIENYVSPNNAENYLNFILEGTPWTVGEVIPEQVEVFNPENGQSEGWVERTCKLNFSGSNCYNAITEMCKGLQLYPIYDCINKTVSLRPAVGKNYGLVYRLGDNIKSDTSKLDGEKVITKLYVTGGSDNIGSSNINIGNATRSYFGYLQGFYASEEQLEQAEVTGSWAIVDDSLQPEQFEVVNWILDDTGSEPRLIPDPDDTTTHGLDVHNYWEAGANRKVYYYDTAPDHAQQWVEGTPLPSGNWQIGYWHEYVNQENETVKEWLTIEIDPISGTPAPWDPNDQQYIISRSPYWTNYILNLKWYYDNKWITKEEILDLYQREYEVYKLNKSFGDKYIEDRRATETAYNNAKNNYDLAEEEYQSTLNNMMNRYYLVDGVPEKGDTYCFHQPPQGVWFELAPRYDELPLPASMSLGDRALYNGEYYEIVEATGPEGTYQYWLAEHDHDVLKTWAPYSCKLNIAHCYECGCTNVIPATYTDSDCYELNGIKYAMTEPAQVIEHYPDAHCSQNDTEVMTIEVATFDTADPKPYASNEYDRYPYGTNTSPYNDGRVKGYRYNPRYKGLFERLVLSLDMKDNNGEDRWTVEDYEQHISMAEPIALRGNPATWFDQYNYIIDNVYVRSTSGQIEIWNEAVDKYIRSWGEMRDYLRDLNDAIVRKQKLAEVFEEWQEKVNEVNQGIQDLYGDFLVEGNYQNTDQPYVAILFNEGMEASDKYSIPEVTYNLDVVDSCGLIEYRRPSIDKYECAHCGYITYRFPYYTCPACGEPTLVRVHLDDIYNDLVRKLHSLGQIIPKAGDYVSIYDEPMGFFGVPGLITEINRYLDSPIKNSIRIDTSYTNEEQLVGNIINATNTVLSNKDIYARTAFLNGDGTIDPNTLKNTLNTSGADISIVSTNGGVLLDGSGLRCINPNDPHKAMKYTGTGIYKTTTLSSENGAAAIWEALMTPDGINATYISSGTIDTNKINITSGTSSKVTIDQYGLSVKNNSNSAYHITPFDPSRAQLETDYAKDWGTENNIATFVGVDTQNKPLIYTKGFLVAEQGSNIANWITNDNGFYHLRSNTSTGKKDLWLSPTGLKRTEFADSGATLGGNANPDFVIYANDNFGVSKTGVMYARGAIIDGNSTITGNITANSLTLGNGVTVPYSSVSGVPDLSIYIAKDGTIGSTPGSSTTGFVVSSAGLLQASNAIIYGTLYSTAGKIGGWNIEDGYLGSLAASQDSGAASTNYFLSQTGKYAYCSMNGSAQDNFYIFLKDQFAVTTAGKLYAKNASISGTISASNSWFSGTISASTINSTTINSATINGIHVRSFSCYVSGDGSDSGTAIGNFFSGTRRAGAMSRRNGTYYLRDVTYGDLVITNLSDTYDIPTV